MKRALAGLTVGAFLTLVVDVVASGRSAVSLVVGAAFLLLATVGFELVGRRPGGWRAYLYVLALLMLGYAVFVVSEASVGATLLLVVLVSQSVLLLPLPAVVAVLAIVPLVHVGMSFSAGLREGLGLLAAVVFAAVVTKLLAREQQARGELAEAHWRLREYAVQVERLVAAEERNRVARDIHDGLGHSLTVVQMQIKAARAVLPADPGRADVVLAKAQDQAEVALREVRRSVSALRESAPPVPLPEALRALADETSAAGVPTELGVIGAARPLLVEAHESLFRAAQEGLTNVRKHARATRAELRLEYSQSANICLEVRDDGTGIVAGDDGTTRPGYGLLGIEERAAHLGGRVTLASAPGKGSTLRVEVPG
ncbi:MAG TPA: sensor histidine kinase [Micromonosporaceae bacterium]|nr:sensor histidine kinase [Micromonosporaceae bacterium]